MGEWNLAGGGVGWVYDVTGPKGQPCTFAFDRPLSEAEQVYLRECAAEGRWEEIHVLIALASA